MISDFKCSFLTGSVYNETNGLQIKKVVVGVVGLTGFKIRE